MFKHRNLLAVCAATLMLTLGLGACGDDDGDATSTDDPVPATDAEDQAAGEGEGDGEGDGEVPTVEIVAVDFGFEGLPEWVEAGTRLTLRNEAEAELHELVAFRLDDDEARSVEEIMGLEPEEMQGVLGEPTTVILAPPGSDEVAVPVGDGTLSEPGRYAIVCMIPTGADSDEYLEAAATSDGPPDVEGGPPHVAHGMFGEVEVR